MTRAIIKIAVAAYNHYSGRHLSVAVSHQWARATHPSQSASRPGGRTFKVEARIVSKNILEEDSECPEE